MSKRATGTKEWSSKSANVISGCGNGCLYCYANSTAARYGRVGPGGWQDEVPGGNALGREPRKVNGVVMFPTTHDITPANLPTTKRALTGLLEAGNSVLIVSKPHLDVIQELCRDLTEHRDRMLFRFSIGTGRQRTLDFLEPGAPPFEERYQALGHASRAGFLTSVSMEPLLEPDEGQVVQLVEVLAPLVNESIWIGKLNKAERRIRNNGHWSEKAAKTVHIIEDSQSDERIRSLFERLRNHPLVRWKESIKDVVGIDATAGSDEAWTGAA